MATSSTPPMILKALSFNANHDLIDIIEIYREIIYRQDIIFFQEVGFEKLIHQEFNTEHIKSINQIVYNRQTSENTNRIPTRTSPVYKQVRSTMKPITLTQKKDERDKHMIHLEAYNNINAEQYNGIYQLIFVNDCIIYITLSCWNAKSPTRTRVTTPHIPTNKAICIITKCMPENCYTYDIQDIFRADDKYNKKIQNMADKSRVKNERAISPRKADRDAPQPKKRRRSTDDFSYLDTDQTDNMTHEQLIDNDRYNENRRILAVDIEGLTLYTIHNAQAKTAMDILLSFINLFDKRQRRPFVFFGDINVDVSYDNIKNRICTILGSKGIIPIISNSYTHKNKKMKTSKIDWGFTNVKLLKSEVFDLKIPHKRERFDHLAVSFNIKVEMIDASDITRSRRHGVIIGGNKYPSDNLRPLMIDPIICVPHPRTLKRRRIMMDFYKSSKKQSRKSSKNNNL